MEILGRAVVLLGLLASQAAWGCVPIELPPGESAELWRGPLMVAGLCLGRSEGAWIRLESVGELWRVRARNARGEVREAMVERPTTMDAREDLGHLALSLLTSGPIVAVEAPPDTAAVAAAAAPKPVPTPALIPAPRPPRVALRPLVVDLDEVEFVRERPPTWGWWVVAEPVLVVRPDASAAGGAWLAGGARWHGWLRMGPSARLTSAHRQNADRQFTSQTLGLGLWAVPQWRVSPVVGAQIQAARRVFREGGERLAEGWVPVISGDVGLSVRVGQRVRLEPRGSFAWDLARTELIEPTATSVLPRFSVAVGLAVVIGDRAI